MTKAKIFDAHFHIIEPSFSVDDYLKKVKDLNVCGGVLISCSFQGYNQDFLLNGLKKLGKNYVGIIQLPTDTTDQEILKLHANGIRGVRFAHYRGASLNHLVTFGKRINDLCGWHVELYTGKVDELKDTIIQLPKVAIDHLGMAKRGLDDLLYLADKGVKVKASGFYRVDFDVKEALKRINPESLMFGTDLPGTRAKRCFSTDDLDLIKETVQDVEHVLWKNAKDFYT